MNPTDSQHDNDFKTSGLIETLKQLDKVVKTKSKLKQKNKQALQQQNEQWSKK